MSRHTDHHHQTLVKFFRELHAEIGNDAFNPSKTPTKERGWELHFSTPPQFPLSEDAAAAFNALGYAAEPLDHSLVVKLPPAQQENPHGPFKALMDGVKQEVKTAPAHAKAHTRIDPESIRDTLPSMPVITADMTAKHDLKRLQRSYIISISHSEPNAFTFG